MKRFHSRWSGEVVAQIDMLLALSVILLALFVLAAPPRPKAQENAVPPGSLVVQLFWPDDVDSDIDLWVKAPGDRPVGYSNKNGRFFDLLRDDLGYTNDSSGHNFETAYSRELPPGEYVINAQAYSLRSAKPPVPIKLVIRMRHGGVLETIATIDSELTRNGEEVTLLRFTIDQYGNALPSSFNQLPMPLRADG